MIAMMLPAAIPWIVVAGTGFAAGYGLVWIAFGAAAAVIQWHCRNHRSDRGRGHCRRCVVL